LAADVGVVERRVDSSRMQNGVGLMRKSERR
jgi:hypothetical protein